MGNSRGSASALLTNASPRPRLLLFSQMGLVIRPLPGKLLLSSLRPLSAPRFIAGVWIIGLLTGETWRQFFIVSLVYNGPGILPFKKIDEPSLFF